MSFLTPIYIYYMGTIYLAPRQSEGRQPFRPDENRLKGGFLGVKHGWLHRKYTD